LFHIILIYVFFTPPPTPPHKGGELPPLLWRGAGERD